jgi:hypothetical protein
MPCVIDSLDDWRKNMLDTNKHSHKAKTGLLFVSAILAVMMLFFAGCSASVTGRLQNSSEVTEVFENSQILPNHQYYIAGFQRVPYAIIAIDNNYQLRSSRWQPIDLDSSSLNSLIYRMDTVYSLNPRGAWILDHEDNRMGVWFSSRYQTMVKREKDNQIVVLTPEPPDLRGIH